MFLQLFHDLKVQKTNSALLVRLGEVVEICFTSTVCLFYLFYIQFSHRIQAHRLLETHPRLQSRVCNIPNLPQSSIFQFPDVLTHQSCYFLWNFILFARRIYKYGLQYQSFTNASVPPTINTAMKDIGFHQFATGLINLPSHY